jgi:DNA modification methylase
VTVKVASRELTEEEREEYVLQFHAGAMGLFDWDKMEGFAVPEILGTDFLLDWQQALHEETTAVEALLLEIGASEAEPQPEETDHDAEPELDRAEELQAQWATAVGQLWQIGEHRLLIGDCTVGENVARLMGGEKAEMLFTDPPYGVSYADKNEFLNAVDNGKRIQTPIANDHESIKDIAADLWLPSFKLALENCTDTASFYLFMPQGGDQMMMMMMMSESGWMPRHELIWVKNNHVLGRADYNYKHEPILYGWKRKGTHKFYGDFQTSIIEVNKPQKSGLHPTTKPVELGIRLIPNNTLPGQLVFDPFLGSGTTMVAAQNLGRKCYGMEISPAYGAVILERMITAFPDIEIYQLDGEAGAE